MGDAFEQKYMQDGARVLHRDKRVARGMVAILAAPALVMFLLAAFFSTLRVAPNRPPAEVPLVLGGMVSFGLFFLFLAISFAVIRTVVTERAIHVKYGLFGPTIPLDSVTASRVVDYDWTEYGGWGIRGNLDGDRAFVASRGEVVEIRYRDADREKKVLVGAGDPHALVAAIERARSPAEHVGVGQSLGSRAAS